jgi:tRNA-modifying protein YgfZ
MSQSSPVLEICRSAAASLVDVAGWELPGHFGDPDGEDATTRESCSVFDRSPQGKLEVTGKDAPSFLHNLGTNDIINLPLGGGCEAYFCDHRAKVLGHVLIYHVLVDGKHAFWLDTTPGHNERILKHLDKHLISEAVELTDQTANFTQLHLAGPTAKGVLEKAIGESMPDLGEFLHMERTLGPNATCHLRRHDSLGVPGYDIVCRNDRAAGVFRMLVAAGAKPAGNDVYESLRIAACTPVYGIDIGDDRFVMEVARSLRAVSYNKGCYLGQEPIVMARDRAGFVNRAQMTVRSTGPLPAGTKLFRDTLEVGLVTSSTKRPGNIAVSMAYLKRGHQEAGLKLRADLPEGPIEVEVLPFPAS